MNDHFSNGGGGGGAKLSITECWVYFKTQFNKK